jgi:hypothetical protein
MMNGANGRRIKCGVYAAVQMQIGVREHI